MFADVCRVLFSSVFSSLSWRFSTCFKLYRLCWTAGSQDHRTRCSEASSPVKYRHGTTQNRFQRTHFSTFPSKSNFKSSSTTLEQVAQEAMISLLLQEATLLANPNPHPFSPTPRLAGNASAARTSSLRGGGRSIRSTGRVKRRARARTASRVNGAVWCSPKLLYILWYRPALGDDGCFLKIRPPTQGLGSIALLPVGRTGRSTDIFRAQTHP